MQRVSTNLTLFLKLFVPTFWAVFFGMFTLITLFYNSSELVLLNQLTFKIWVAGLYLFFFILFYFTFFSLKRVELGKEFYHVSNYFSTFRLIYDDIKKIKEIKMLRWVLVIVYFKGKSSLGKQFFFLANKNLYYNFLKDNAEVREVWESKILNE